MTRRRGVAPSAFTTAYSRSSSTVAVNIVKATTASAMSKPMTVIICMMSALMSRTMCPSSLTISERVCTVVSGSSVCRMRAEPGLEPEYQIAL